MRKIKIVCLLFGVFAIAHGSDSDTAEFDKFIVDIIDSWQLLSSTLIVGEDLPKFCTRLEWLLCLPNESDSNELAEHLAAIDKHRKHDGVIFVGQGHEKLLKQLAIAAPDMLTSNYPTFMPFSYKFDINLRLDSNIIFYEEKSATNYGLYDIFAVKGGSPITEVLGNWNMMKGISLVASMNRWDRRGDLQGAILTNALFDNAFVSDFIRDDNGSIIGSKGLFQDQLFYVTDSLNVTIEVAEAAWDFKLYENGSYGGPIGMLRRGEADVVTVGLGVNLFRSDLIDYAIPTWRPPITLIAAIPKGTSSQFWIYVRVFGVSQWVIFVALLMLSATGISIIIALTNDESGMEFGTKKSADRNYNLDSVSSGVALVYLYALQMGSHTNSKQLAPRLLTFTISFLTMLLFVYYTGDITSEMTSGDSKVPIREKTWVDLNHRSRKLKVARLVVKKS